jgi:hypothetical protein
MLRILSSRAFCRFASDWVWVEEFESENAGRDIGCFLFQLRKVRIDRVLSPSRNRLIAIIPRKADELEWLVVIGELSRATTFRGIISIGDTDLGRGWEAVKSPVGFSTRIRLRSTFSGAHSVPTPLIS